MLLEKIKDILSTLQKKSQESKAISSEKEPRSDEKEIESTEITFNNTTQTAKQADIDLIDDKTVQEKQMYKQALNDEANNINLQNAELLDIDLVEADYFNGCCGECAKYRGRIFSISGKDKRFPKMPENYGCTCSGLEFFPFVYGASESSYCPKNTDIITWSNRPFVDDRSRKEKEVYQHTLDEEFLEECKEKDHSDYDKLIQMFPDETPKSFSAYRRAKNSNSTKFQALASKAESMGMHIALTDEEQATLERYKKYVEKYGN